MSEPLVYLHDSVAWTEVARTRIGALVRYTFESESLPDAVAFGYYTSEGQWIGFMQSSRGVIEQLTDSITDLERGLADFVARTYPAQPDDEA